MGIIFYLQGLSPKDSDYNCKIPIEQIPFSGNPKSHPTNVEVTHKSLRLSSKTTQLLKL